MVREGQRRRRGESQEDDEKSVVCSRRVGFRRKVRVGRLVEYLLSKALSSNPSTTKNK
jgi:hypothetical protein